MNGQSRSVIHRRRAGSRRAVACWTIPACRLLLMLVGVLAVLVGASAIGVRLKWRAGPQDEVFRGQPGLIRRAAFAMAAFHMMASVSLWRRGRDSQGSGTLTARGQSFPRRSAIQLEPSRRLCCILTCSPSLRT